MENTVMNVRRSILLSLLVIGLTCAVPIASAPPSEYENPSPAKAIQSNTSTAKNASNTHKLVVKTTGSSVTYTVSASKKISISSGKNESVDTTQGTTVTGRLGKTKSKKKKKSKDTTDVITYSGYIESFQYRGNGNDIRVFLDGKLVPPEVIAANHIRISSPKTASGNKSRSARYQVPVSGRAIMGESTEKQDTAKAGTIRGRINGDSDSFYFTGNSGSLSFDGEVVVFINGQKLTGGQNQGARPPTPQTGSSTDSQQMTQTDVSGDSMGSNPTKRTPITGDSMAEKTKTNTPSGSSSNGGSGSGSSSGNGFLYGLAGGVLVMGVLGFVAVKYFAPRDRRW